MRVTRFHHVSVNTNAMPLDDMVAFYRDVLGLADIDRPEIPGVPGHWHRVGDQELHLVDAPSSGAPAAGAPAAGAPAAGAPAAGGGIDPTGHHYCVAVDDLDAAVAELDARGIEYLRAVQGAGTVQIWITDPAGNTIELQQETGAR